MRRHEILALRWPDVDLARKEVVVRHTFSCGASGFEMGEPKSSHGRRSIAIPDSVVKSLHKHRIAQLEHRVHLGELYTDHDMVFATPTGNPLPPNTLASRFQRLIARAGVPKIRIHDLRHTSATLMLANNVHPKIVQERLGHADVSMTLNRYSHVTMDMQRDAADQFDAAMG
jgi:integrase